MSDTTFEDDRKLAAVDEREPRDLEKGGGGGGGVKLPQSANNHPHQQSHHKHSQGHSHKHQHHHHHHVATQKDTKPPYNKSSKTVARRRMEEVDDEAIAKPREPFAYAPSLVARRPAAVPKAPEEKVDKELPASTAFGQFHLPPPPPPRPATTLSPTIASATEIAGMLTNQGRTNALMIPRDPASHAPGAFAVNGPNDAVGDGQDDDNFTYTQQDDTNVNSMNDALSNPANPVEARLVDDSDDVENLQEQLRRRDEALRQRDEALQQMQRQQENILVGQVLSDVGKCHQDDEEENSRGIDSNKCIMPHGKVRTLIPVITLTIAVTLCVTGICFDCWYPAVQVGIAAGGLGGITMVALWPITCTPYSKKWIRILCSAVVLAFVLQLIAVVAGCVGGFSIVAAVLYLISAVTICRIPECSCIICCCTMPHGKLDTLIPVITLTITVTVSTIGSFFEWSTFGLAACVVGGITMVALWPITCTPYSKKWIRSLCSSILSAFVLQLLAIILDWAGIFSIIATVLYLISALTVWKIPESGEVGSSS